MTRFADPGRCPDCRATLTPGSFVCPSCRLDLGGEQGQRLFTLLTQADQLLVQMRARSATRVEQPVGAPAGPAAPLAPPVAPGPMRPVGPATPYPAPAPAVRGSAVPRILLGLGAMTMLVAVSLFFWVAWDALGPGGRTVTLMLLTAASGVVTVALAQRDLRAATEALGTVSLGLLTGVVWGARDAGWLAATNGAQLSIVLGSVLVVAGLVAALLLTRTRAGRLLAGEVAAAIGALVVLSGIAASDWSSLAGRLVVAVPLLAAVTLLARLLVQLLPEPPEDPSVVPDATVPGPAARRFAPMQVATGGLALVALLGWVALGLAALDRVTRDLTVADVWTGGGLPLLATGLYAVLPALLPGHRTVRVTALALAVLPWTALVTAPAWDEDASTLAAVMAVTTVVLAAVLGLARLPWARAAGAGLAVSAPVLVVQALVLLAEGLAAFARAAGQEWTGTPGGRLDPDLTGLPAPWVLPVAVLVLVATGFAAWRAVTGGRPTRPQVERVVEVALVAAVHGALLVTRVPVVVLLVVMLLTTLRIGVDSLRGHRRMSLEAAGIAVALLGAATLILSAYDEWLSLLACVVLGALAALFHRHPGWTSPAGGAALSLLGAGALWTVAALVDLEGEWAAVMVLLTLGAWLVVRGLADDGEESAGSTDAADDRPWLAGVVGVEAGTVLAAVVTSVLGADRFAPADQVSTWTAVYLTLMGVVATVVALTRPERRRPAGWTGGVLLAAASWVRLADLGVEAPEPYTLPSAVALLVVGWFHLRRHADAGTLRAWSSGLGLALVPTLLWVLADPLSLRAMLLGLACLGLVLAGSSLRWAAPFVWGAAVGTVLVLRLVAPVALLVGPFLVFALGGVVLLVVGATWEHRLRDAERLRRYVDGLR